MYLLAHGGGESLRQAVKQTQNQTQNQENIGHLEQNRALEQDKQQRHQSRYDHQQIKQ